MQDDIWLLSFPLDNSPRYWVTSSSDFIWNFFFMDEEDHTAQLLNRYREVRGKIPTDIDLCLVSKFRPAWEIEILHRLTGHRYFGENYSQDLISKAAVCPSDIKWAFIGHLQSNKVNTLIKSVPNLHVVETLDSVTLASKLNDGMFAVVRTYKVSCRQVLG